MVMLRMVDHGCSGAARRGAGELQPRGQQRGGRLLQLDSAEIRELLRLFAS